MSAAIPLRYRSPLYPRRTLWARNPAEPSPSHLPFGCGRSLGRWQRRKASHRARRQTAGSPLCQSTAGRFRIVGQRAAGNERRATRGGNRGQPPGTMLCSSAQHSATEHFRVRRLVVVFFFYRARSLYSCRSGDASLVISEYLCKQRPRPTCCIAVQSRSNIPANKGRRLQICVFALCRGPLQHRWKSIPTLTLFQGLSKMQPRCSALRPANTSDVTARRGATMRIRTNAGEERADSCAMFGSAGVPSNMSLRPGRDARVREN